MARERRRSRRIGSRKFTKFRVTPISELVGWTVLSGKVAITESPTSVRIEDAGGDTIVNAKFGVRFGVGCNSQLYVGYGQALTGDRFYDNIWRFEYRIMF